MFKNLMVRAKDEKGQTIVEYCIMVGIVGLAMVAASPGISNSISSFFVHIGTQLSTLG
jgi:Flp pilus assembly pilin Flp